MASPVTEDQDQRNNTGLEDMTTTTIESLRAQLLSERAISKSSRQRADELARRVSELEEQLKMVSLQRKKAEKATADVLAILESNGITDASDAYDSNSDQETISDDTVKRKETSSNFEVRRNDLEAYSSSEIDSSPSTGRSLSWKSCKDSLHPLQKSKYMETVRRRISTFTSNGSSLPKRVGKSCRRIRRRESRYVTEPLQKDANMHDLQDNTVDTSSRDSLACADIEHPANHGVDAPETPISGSLENKGANGYYSDRNGKNEHVDGTLQGEAQFSGQFEAEEKVRENSGSMLDACDPGNRSDVTEERDDMKASDQLNPEVPVSTQNLGSDLEVVKPRFSEELQLKVSKSMVVPSKIDDADLQDPKMSDPVASGSSLSQFTYCSSKGNQTQVFLGNLDKVPPQSSHVSSISNGSVEALPAQDPSVSSKDGESSGTKNELAFIAQKSSTNIGSVLDALRQARLSLNQKIQSVPQLESGSSVKAIELSVPDIRTRERMDIPTGCPGIFRLPTDFHCEVTAKANYLGSNSALILPSGYHEATSAGLLGSPYDDRRSSAFLGNNYYVSSPPPFTENGSGVHRPAQTSPFSQGVSGLHASTMPFMERERLAGISGLRIEYGKGFDAGNSFSSRSSYSDHQMNPGFVPGSHTSAMPFMEIQPGNQAKKHVYENGFDTSPSSSGRSSYHDPQMNSALVLPGRHMYVSHPFSPEVARQVHPQEKIPRNAASQEHVVPSSSGFSFYDDQIRQNLYK